MVLQVDCGTNRGSKDSSKDGLGGGEKVLSNKQ